MFTGGATTCFCDECCGPSVTAAPAIVIRRHFDAELHNRIANHPAVRPTIGYKPGPLDFSPLFEASEHYVLLSDGDGAAAIFEWSAPGVWTGHSAFLPESRGKYGVAAGRAMLRWMFDEMNVRMLWGMTPVTHRAANLFNRQLGMKPEGEIIEQGGRLCRLWTIEERP
jgi:hypothetical protein